jgi:hypothetical protein
MQTDIEFLLEQTRVDAADHRAEILAYLKSFPHIVLRGAGNFGSAFGALLIRMGVEKEKMRYQDIRADRLREVGGIPVEFPGLDKAIHASTLVINCIPNGPAGMFGKHLLQSEGYLHPLSGMALFESLMCGLRRENFDAHLCVRTQFCNWCVCKRLSALLAQKSRIGNREEHEGGLVFPVLTFVVNQKCTLECSHCGQYMNHFPLRDRVNFSLRQIKEDIDHISKIVDAVGFIALIGGEPFLHPDLDQIIAHVFTKRNFGVLGVATNGVCRMDDAVLDALCAGPARVIFSDYTPALNEKQKRLFFANVDKVASRGISHTIGRPLWSMPPTLHRQWHPDSVKGELKSACVARESCRLVCNGHYYPCGVAESLDALRLEHYADDKIPLTGEIPARDLQRRIWMLEQKDFFASCDHCGEEGSGDLLKISGEQGISERYAHLGSDRGQRIEEESTNPNGNNHAKHAIMDD